MTRVGVPMEVKADEYRVALTPAGVETLVRAGHEVLVERGAGDGSGFPEDAYARAGAQLRADAASVWAEADLVLKVKEPVESEWPLLRAGQVVFGYFHFAGSEPLTPMSEVAGRMAVQEGARYLEKPQGGLGVLLGGVPGVPPGKVVVLGGGIVGRNAARIAAGLGARVAILDVDLDRLRHIADVMPANVQGIFSTRHAIREQLRDADLVVGAVLIPGARAPRLVLREDLALLRPGAVIVDVAVDQGGCVETIRPTTHQDPVYVVDGIVHYGVTNMPAGVPRTSTIALTNATLPYVERLAGMGWRRAAVADAALRRGVNVADGSVTHPGVAEAFGLDCTPVEALLLEAKQA